MKQAMLFSIAVSFCTSLTCALPENLKLSEMSTKELQAEIHKKKVKNIILEAQNKCLGILVALKQKQTSK